MSDPHDPLRGFEKLSPARQKLLLRRLGERRPGAEAIPRSPRRQGDGRFPLSFAQRRLWFLAHLEPGQIAYHLPYALRLTGSLDVSALAAALTAVAARHEALRTTFELAEGEPWQRVLPPAPVPLPQVDLAALPPEARATESLRRAAEEASRPFDVDRGPHLRATLLHLAPEEHALLFTLHHLVSDAWSMGILVREIGDLYQGFVPIREGGGAPRPGRGNGGSGEGSGVRADLAIQYPDYADWQRERLAGPELERLLAWWREALTGLPGALDLPADRPRPAVPSGRGGHIHGVLSPERTDALRAVREREGDTLFMILLAAFAALLRRMTGQEDLAVGSPVANRPRQELEPLIGFFVNTLVLRVDTAGDPTFRELLARVRAVTLGAYAHQDLPFEKLVEELRPARDLSRTPLFQVMLALQNAWERQTPDLPGLDVEPLGLFSPTAKFDLSLNAAEAPDGLGLTLEYATDLFDTTTAWRLAGHLTTLLATLTTTAADPARRLSDLPLWTEVERHQVLVEWNDAREEDPDGPQTLHALVAAQTRRTPDAIALVAGPDTLTYADLDRRAEALAERLRAQGAGPEVIVAVRLPRSADLVVALLGVLKAGAAYLPIDPGYPEERSAFMVRDAGAGWALTPRPPLPPPRSPSPGEGEIAMEISVLPSPASFPPRPGRLGGGSGEGGQGGEGSGGGLAYVIYTSGSTGTPKGVAIEHRSAAALVRWARTVFAPAELAGVLASTSVCFDLSVFEIFVPLATGGRVILVEDALRLRELPADRGVTLVNTVPSALDALLRSGGLPASVRTVNLAGEPIPRDLVERVRRLPGVRLLNLYGPSEDTTYSTWAEVHDAERPAPIGRPVAGTRAHLVDADERPVPVGAPGHLVLGGAGLARGYVRRPDLTAERFVPDPFATDGWRPGDRLYRTGDLARRRADGVLEFLGRIDQQVKIRGFRIEPGEIEAALTALPEVREAAVGVWTAPSGDRRLVAWVAGDASAAELRARLGERLPAPMIPSAFVLLEALPRTANGKLDRKALPPPEAPAGVESAAPANETERAVAAIWCDVLGVGRVGPRDNFFDLGGHSLLLVRVHERLKTDLGADLPLVDLFRFPDVASLARRLRGAEAETPAPVAIPSPQASHDIAVIGMAGRFPGAPDLAAFWANLRDGVESITFFSRAEMLAAGVPADQADHPAHVPARGHLDGIDLFDAAFFDLSPREASFTDPQHRLFLETCSEALERAGVKPGREGVRAGVWAGMAFSTYAVANLLSHAGRPEAPGGLELLAGNDKDFLATRVAYKLDLRGPAMTVQTACSSSLVAVHLACRGLLGGECEVALAGGVSVHLPQKTGYDWQEGGILSPDGHCRSFDADARGTVGGDGVGVVVLKPLERALADGDPIHAVIRGSALSNDGAGKVGFTAPSVEGQARAIAEAQAVARVAPSSIGLVEAHGSATPLGDPIEVAALHQVFGAGAGPATCALGSVKSNVGHLDAAAGIAGLLKAVLAVQHGEIPPSLHFRAPNPRIDFATGPFYVPTERRPWPTERGPRRAGVSSFGLGGTNVHVVLEEAPTREPEPAAGHAWQLLVLSARTETALEAATDRLARHLQEHPDLPLADVAWTLQAGRRAREHRRAVAVRSGEDAHRALSLRDPKRLLTGASRGGARPVAFVFPGLGEQYGGMGASLYRDEPVFRAAIDRCAGLLGPRLGRDLRALLGFDQPPPAADGAAPEGPDLRRLLRRNAPAERADRELLRTAIAQPAVFALEFALAELWLSWGIRPQAVIGYSLGEYVAACVAGVLSLEDALLLVAERARWIEELPPGALLAVGLAPEEIEPLLGEALSLAAVNGPRLCVVAGPPAAIADLETRLAARGDAFRPVETTHAFHSRMMLPLTGRLTELVRTLERHPPRLPCLSNVTGTWLTAADALDPAYWSRHLTGTVHFAAGIATLWQEPDRILVEVGPGGSLTSMALQHLATVDPGHAGDRLAVRSLPSLHEHRPDRSDRAYLLHALAKLWLAGVEPAWEGVHAGERRRKVELPGYPFERGRFWVEGVRGGEENGSGRWGGETGDVWVAAPLRPHPLTPSPIAPPSTGRGGTHADSGTEDVKVLPSPARGRGAGGEGSPLWWLFAGSAGLATRIAPHLAAAGARVELIIPGDRFDRTKDRTWSLRPTHRTDLTQLLAATGQPAGVLHLWSLQSPGGGAPRPGRGPGGSGEGTGVRALDAFEHHQTHLQAALTLLRVLGEHSTHPTRLLLATDPTLCEAATADHPHLHCRTLDLQFPLAESAAADLAAEALYGEDPRVAFRDGRRWIRRPAASPAVALAEAIGEPGAPLAGHARPNLRNAYAAPEGEIERTLAGHWQRLLGIAAVGRHDSFFEMGGHSLLATQLMGDVRVSWGVSLPLAALFENPTIAELAALVARRRREGDLGDGEGAAVLPEVVADPERRFEPFPLTDIQQAYWLGRSAAFEMGDIGSYIYQETDFTGLDLGRLETALRRAVDRHDMLRAVFLPDGRQRVLPAVPPYRLPVFDLAGLPAAAREEALLAVRREMSHQVFDVGCWPLFDLRAARLGEDRVRLFFGIDVLIGDGWSFTLLFRDLARFYLDPSATPEPLGISFRDYVMAEAALHETPAYQRSLDYWLGRLADLPGAPELPLAANPAALGRPQFHRRTARVDAPSWKRLQERGARAGLTPSGLLLAAFSEVLATWSASPRFTLTLTLFNRPPVHPQIHELVGDFTSLTLLAVDASLGGGFEALARAVQERLWRDLEHRAVSGVRVLRELARVQGRQVALPVIFTSALGLHPEEDEAFAGPAEAFPPDAGIRSEPGWGVSQTPQVWIDHQVGEHAGELSFNWDVVEDLFPAGMIDAMWSAYRDLLRRLAEDDAAWTAERRRLLPTQQLARRVLAGSAVEPVSHDRLHGLFAARAARHPDRPAVLAPSRTLTYGELSRRANRLGRHLRELGAKPNTLVAVVQEKGWEQIVSVLAVLASGAAYLPIEPGLPRDRIRSLLERSEATIAVTTPGVDASIDWPEGLHRVLIGEEMEGDDAPLDPVQRTTDLAYVIFTSGSTGQPKGVMIDHRGAVNTILEVNRTWNVGPDDRVLALSSLSFDLSVWDVFGMLAAGGAIVLPRADAQREPAHWLERLRDENVTLWNTVPALLRMLADFLEAGPRGAFESPLRLALLSGDWIPLDLPDRVRALSPGTRLVSLGGATEASIWSIWYPIDRVDPSWKSIPYGRPMANQTVHVLDDRQEPRPDWVPGHLYLGGLGLAKGYWRDPEKTAASFGTHPESGERLYRTGDLGRALPDGTIELLGREDFQVKIQGYRIELGEIEAALADHRQVRAAVAAATGDRMATRRLVAWIVPAGLWDGLAETLREHLRSRLPDYMIPAVFVPLDTLPLGPNGKLDRRLLPAPEAALGRGDRQPPQTGTEETLAAIWAEVLRRPAAHVGRGDNFFELGGDSLLATRIMARVREIFALELPLRTFFETLTLETQAAAIDRERPQAESDDEKLAKLLEKLQDASPEEVERMLAELRGEG